MHDELWAGVQLKLQHAEFQLDQMARSLEPPSRTRMNVALEASGASIDIGWQRSFYAHLDAFLSAARSVAVVINFGVDDRPRVMKDWFNQLPADEQARRHEFMRQFQPHDATFGQLPLNTARHISEHRTGYPPVTVTVSGLFGVTHIGDPVTSVPISEARHIDDPDLSWMAQQHPLRPKWQDFKIDGRELFPECREHLGAAQALLNEARRISTQVHGGHSLTPPPTFI